MYARRDALGSQAEWEDEPQGRERRAVDGRVARANADGAPGHPPLDERENLSAQNQRQPQVHGLGEECAEEEFVLARHKEFEEERIPDGVEVVAGVGERLELADHDEHEPPEGEAHVHVAQELVALPDAAVDEHFGHYLAGGA